MNKVSEKEYYDEWKFKEVLQQFDITNEGLLLALNNHMDAWATSYMIKEDTAKRTAYNEVLLHARQLKLKGMKSGRTDTLLEEFIDTLKASLEEE